MGFTWEGLVWTPGMAGRQRQMVVPSKTAEGTDD